MKSSHMLRLAIIAILSCITISLASAQMSPDSLRRELHNVHPDTIRVNILNRISYEITFSDTDSSRVYAQQARALAIKSNFEYGLADAYTNIGFTHHIVGALDSALANYQKAYEIQLLRNDSLRVSGLLNNMGSVYNIKGNYPKSLELYQLSLSIKLQLNELRGASKTVNNIGIIHYNQKQYDKALDYYKQSLKIEKKIKDKLGEARSLSNIGLVYLDLKQYDEALKNYEKAVLIHDSLKLPCRKLYAVNGLGQSYFQLQKWTEAKKYLTLALKEAEECQDPVITSSALVSLGKISVQHNETSLAESQMTLSYQVAKNNDLKIQMKEASTSLYELYKLKNNTAKALAFLEISNVLKDSLQNEDLTEQLTRLEMNYTFEQERDSISFAQQKELLTYENRIKKQRLIQTGTLIGLIIAAGFILIVYRYYRLKSRANAILETKNLQITEALEEREVLLQEVHHRVKNNLQVVSSLLNIQSKFLESEQAKRAILEGRDRVHSMALIHQKLYESNNLSRINIHEYFTQLSEALFNSYRINDEVKLSTEIENLDVDLDTSIHLGLIVNELVSNSLKHGFSETNQGVITLSLKRKDKQIELKVSDTGKGIQDEKLLLKSHGFRIVQSLVRALKAELEIIFHPGTSVVITFDHKAN